MLAAGAVAGGLASRAFGPRHHAHHVEEEEAGEKEQQQQVIPTRRDNVARKAL
jgi:hypothetical protein